MSAAEGSRHLRVRLGVAAAVVLVALAVSLIAWRRGDDEARFAVVARRDLEQTIETTGVVEPVEAAIVSGAVSGRIEIGAVRAGNRVERHDIVARLDRAPFEAAVAAARRAVEAAELRLTLLETRAAGGGEAAVEAVAAAAEVGEARAALEAAEGDLRATAVLAPVAGTVLAVEAVEGQPYEAGAPIATINAGDRLQVVAQLDQIDLPPVPVGTVVRVVIDAFPATELAGRVETVAPRAAPAAGGALFPATIAVPDLTTLGARPGMTATVIVPAVVAADALVVPAEAVRTVGRRSMLTVVRDGDAVTVEIETGLRADGLVEITAGDVREGERVRLDG